VTEKKGYIVDCFAENSYFDVDDLLVEGLVGVCIHVD
jgi:hypothetical protein